MSVGTVAQAPGSAYLEVGNVKVLCSVHGPRSDAASAAFSNTGRLSCSSAIEAAELQVQQALRPALEAAVVLEKYPKSVVDVHILVLEEDGDVVAACITCAALALAHGGFEMLDLVAACSVARQPDESLEIDAPGCSGVSGGGMMLAMMPLRGEITQLSHVGDWEVEQLEEALQLGMEGCRQVQTLMRAALVESEGKAAGDTGDAKMRDS
ncbi:ribosomal protein S5 domain 2-like protein [Baffinella frigidus]|nr:ribosomal protein S5 domain 2-like protein [Cryptophyta sp. CCMP2293]